MKYDSGSGSEDEGSTDENAGTEHYEKVGYVLRAVKDASRPC